jgi:signal peptidase
MAPAFGLIVIRNQVLPKQPGEGETLTKEGQLTTGWVMVMGLAVALLWFNSGLFGFQPTLVSGVSMSPALKAGDIVITKDVAADEIEVGDIIRFQKRDSFIIHRVISIEYESGRYYFTTQGDANNVEDPPVLEGQLGGKVILTIPKLGWLSIGVRRLFELFL